MKKPPSILKKWAAQVPAPSKTLREAYLTAWSDAQCAAWGKRTSAKLVLRQGMTWLPLAMGSLKRGDASAYSLRRVAFLVGLLVELEAMVLETSSQVPDRAPFETLMARATTARKVALQRAALMVGGDARRAAQLAEVWATPRDPRAMVKALSGLVTLLHRWREDTLSAALADDVGLDGAAVAELEDLCVELDRESEPFIGVPQRRGDAPATNVLEGRVLRELRMLQLAFEDARENGVRVPALRVLAGLKGLLAPKSKPSRAGRTKKTPQ